MSSQAEANREIKAFLAGIAHSIPAERVGWENAPLDPTPDVDWLFWRIVPTTSSRQSLGGGGNGDLRRERGRIIGEIFGRPDVLEGEVMAVADALASALRDAVIPVPATGYAVRVGEPRTVKLGTNRQGLYELHVEAPYKRDERI